MALEGSSLNITSSQIAAFASNISEDLGVKINPIPDGHYHRFDDPAGKANNQACWYRLCADLKLFGHYENLRLVQQVVLPKPIKLTNRTTVWRSSDIEATIDEIALEGGDCERKIVK